ncbi:hypothetical protein V8C86DRAFT_2616122 [Haematococcus lacustris]
MALERDAESEALSLKLHREINLGSLRRRPAERSVLAIPSRKLKQQDRAAPHRSSRSTSSGDQDGAEQPALTPVLTTTPDGPAPAQGCATSEPPSKRPRPQGEGHTPDALPCTSPAAALQIQSLAPIQAAAVAASAAVRAQLKELQAQCLSGDASRQCLPRRVKIFYAGVRWGISLPTDGLKTRSDLATALNVAFAGEILSCGRGDMLSVTFVDRQGQVSELPPRRLPRVVLPREGSSVDSDSNWAQLVEQAAKVYVRRVHCL